MKKLEIIIVEEQPESLAVTFKDIEYENTPPTEAEREIADTIKETFQEIIKHLPAKDTATNRN